jgi:hypothetical protein
MPVVEFGPKDTAAQKLGKEVSDVLQAAFKKGPGRWTGAMMEGLQALQAGTAFQQLMAAESDATEEATFDTKAAAAQIGLGIAMDNAKDYSSLDD